MTHASVAGSEHRRSRLAGSTSLALHGGLLLVVVLAGQRVAHSPQQPISLTAIELVTPAPASPSTPLPDGNPVARATSPTANVEARGRRQQVQRSQPKAPAAKLSHADLKISYDHPSNFAKPATTIDEAGDPSRSGIGKGVDRQLGDEIANMPIPQPPVASLARAPRPRHDYSKLRLRGASRFAGQTIKVVLKVDPYGRVRGVQLLEGVDRDLDRRVIALVHDFQFEPALDEEGAAIPGTSRWNLELVEDEHEPFPTLPWPSQL
jgi:hypothetical protein